jgi:hypothetical protein
MNSTEESLKVFQRIDQLHLKAFRDAFPGIPIRNWSQSGGDFELHVPNENQEFYESEYFYKGDMQFFHLTPIKNLFSVLNDRSFRLYDLHSSADPQEYSYAARILGLSEAHIDNRKRFYYTFSFCPIAELRNKHIWKAYGDTAGSAAIVFEVVNDPKCWKSYHISEIKYGSPGSFESYKRRARDIEAEYRGISLHCDLSRLIANARLDENEYYYLRGQLCESFKLNFGYEVEMDLNLFRI